MVVTFFSVEDVMSSSRPLTKEQVVEMFPDVFDGGLGLLEGEYHIRLNDSAKPVQHAPRRGQVSLRNKIKETLEELHFTGVIEPVSKPTPWISSMLAVPKKNGHQVAFYTRQSRTRKTQNLLVRTNSDHVPSTKCSGAIFRVLINVDIHVYMETTE